MVTRVGGLATGMDIDKLVTDMLKGRKAQIDKLKQQQTKVNWQKTDFQTLYTGLSEFRNVVSDFKLSKTLAPKKAVSSDETKITATPLADALPGTHTLSVSKLADKVVLSSTDKITAAGKTKDSLASQFGINANFVIGINGKAFTVSPTWSINDFATALNAYGGNVNATYDAVADKFSLYTTNTGAYDSTGGARLDFAGSDAVGIDFIQNSLKLAGLSANRASTTMISGGKTDKSTVAAQFGASSLPAVIKFTVNNGSVVTVDTSKPLSQVMTDIMASNSDIVASYDAQIDRVFLSSKTGKAISFNAPTGTLNAQEYLSGLSFLENQLKLDVSYGAGSQNSLPVPGTNKLADQFKMAPSTFNISINGTIIAVDTANDDMAALVGKINATTTRQAYYDTVSNKLLLCNADRSQTALDFSGSDAAGLGFLTDQLKVLSTITTDVPANRNGGAVGVNLATQFGLGAAPFTLTLQGNGGSAKTITVNPAIQTMQSLLDAINGAQAGVTASYNAATKQISVANSDGTSGRISLTGSSAAGMSFWTDKLNLPLYTMDAPGTSTGVLPGLPTDTLAVQFGMPASTFTLKLRKTGSSTAGSISIDTSTMTLNQLMTAITNSTGGVNATYNAGKVMLANKDGTTTAIDFTGSDSAALSFLSTQLQLSVQQGPPPASSYSAIADQTIAAPAVTLLKDAFGMGSGAFSIVVNDKAISVDPATQTMDGLMAALTSAGAGVKAVYDKAKNQVQLTRTDGATSNISFAGTSAAGLQFLTNNLKLLYTSPSSYALRGTDAELKLDGIAQTSHDNAYKKDNVTYNLKAVTTSDISITVSSDVDTAVASVKKFVEAYNKVLDQYNTKLAEKRVKIPGNKYSYYEPLTEEQRSAMKDTDISKWEEQAKKGMLFNDPLVSNIIQSLRQDLSTPIMRYPTASVPSSTYAQNDKSGFTLEFNEPLYKSLGGDPPIYSPLASGTDVTDKFTVSAISPLPPPYSSLTGTPQIQKATYSVINGKATVQIQFKGPDTSDPKTATVRWPYPGEKVEMKTDVASRLYNSRGVQYQAKPTILTGDITTSVAWSYPKNTNVSATQVSANAWMTAASIGISTDNGSGYLQYKDGGKLYIDESKLKAALNADPDILKNIFGTVSDTDDRKGIAVRLFDHATQQLKDLNTKAGAPGALSSNSALDKKLYDFGTRIYDLTRIMNTEEDRYYKRFSQMEKVIQKMNEQGNWLANQTGQASK